jgi:S1-C subfamily serine protease
MLGSIHKFPVPALMAFMIAIPSTAVRGASVLEAGRASVIKIYVTNSKGDFAMPWQMDRPNSGTGTGFIIKGRRILTNAHLVADVQFLQVQKSDDSRRYPATVKFVAHDCDLAMLEVADAEFFEETRPLRFANALPTLNDEVLVLGYPLGGERLSVTKGVVSRLSYTSYSHSGVDQHLVLQVDAAINPGNSGGPVIFRGKVVGLAFQGLAWADNIGYGIPLPVLERFLKDVEDGKYDGYPELGVAYLGMRNPALRSHVKLSDDQTGVLVHYVDPFGAGKDYILSGDVLLEIDGYAIDNDGTIKIDGERVVFAEVLERLQWGDEINFKVWRHNAAVDLQFPLDNPTDPFLYRNLYDTQPEYFITGGLVFSPLTRDYMRTLKRSGNPQNINQIQYLSEYSKIDGHYENRDAFIVLIRRLAHPVNTYMNHFLHGIVESVNGQKIRDLRMLSDALQSTDNEYHVVRFLGLDEMLVIDAEAARRADPEIFATYGIRHRENLGKSQ